jgi:hypothetical protein
MTQPQYFFIFCNLLHPATKHNLRFTNGFASAGAGSWAISKNIENDKFWQAYEDGSADYIPFIPNAHSETSVKAISPFWMSVTAEYRVEYDAELCRQANSPLSPSRFSCIYAFGDWESCQVAADKWGWRLDDIRVFVLEPGEYNRVSRVNMEVVSLARTAYRTASFSAEEIHKIWSHYWRGGGDMTLEFMVGDKHRQFESGVIWEYLIEGRVTKLRDTDPATFKPPKH